MQVPSPVAMNSTPKKNHRRWAPDERQRLLNAVNSYFPDRTNISWSVIAEYVGTRTEQQCRERYVFRENASITRSQLPFWTHQEEDLLIDCFGRFKNNWREYGPIFPSRSVLSVKSKCYNLIRAVRHGSQSIRPCIIDKIKIMEEALEKCSRSARNLKFNPPCSIPTSYSECLRSTICIPALRPEEALAQDARTDQQIMPQLGDLRGDCTTPANMYCFSPFCNARGEQSCQCHIKIDRFIDQDLLKVGVIKKCHTIHINGRCFQNVIVSLFKDSG